MKGYTHSFDKFNLATSSLTEVETMMYLRLLWELYETEEPIRYDSYNLMKITKSDDERLVMWIVDKYFEVDERGVTHSYVRKQLNKSQAIRSKMTGVVRKSWDVLNTEGKLFWSKLPKEKEYKHKGLESALIGIFRLKKKKINTTELISYVESYFKNHEDSNFWKSPKRLVEEYLKDPKFRYGKEQINNYTKGVK